MKNTKLSIIGIVIGMLSVSSASALDIDGESYSRLSLTNMSQCESIFDATIKRVSLETGGADQCRLLVLFSSYSVKCSKKKGRMTKITKLKKITRARYAPLPSNSGYESCSSKRFKYIYNQANSALNAGLRVSVKLKAGSDGYQSIPVSNGRWDNYQ